MNDQDSTALSIKRFIDKVGKPKTPPKRMAAAIAEAFNLSEDSSEFQWLLHAQSENFLRLLNQLDASKIGEPARSTYRKQVTALSRMVRHDYLYKQHEAVRTEVIASNQVALTYLDDALKLTLHIDGSAKAALSDYAAQLQDVLDEISNSDLPDRVKGVLRIQLARLIFLLKHHDAVGIDQAWEQAFTTLATLSRDAHLISDVKGQGFFGSLGGKLTALVGLMAILNGCINEASEITQHLKSGYEWIQKWDQASNRPLLEDHRPKSGGKTRDSGEIPH